MEGSGPTEERVLPGTRRPDGTIRKEIRIRAGYVPQDEVARYEAKGSRPRNAGPAVPPGVDPGHAAQASAKSKAARKNEKRKEKKQSSEPDIVSERESSGAAATGIEKGMGALQLAPRESSGAAQDESSSRPSRNVQPSSASADAGTDGSAFIELEKKIRALRKKIRQAESLEAASASRQRTPEEEDKIRRLELWRKELIELEAAQRI